MLGAAVDAARAAVASRDGPGALRETRRPWVDGARALAVPPRAIRAAVQDDLVARLLPRRS